MGGEPLPPLYPLWTELPRWLRDVHGLTETEIRDVRLRVRRFPTHFRVVGEKEHLSTLNDCDVNWETGRARWEQDTPGIASSLEVLWAGVEDAVTWLRKLQQRERLAQAPAPEPAAPAEAPPYRTGVQGRPTSVRLIPAELERRRVAEETLDTQAAESTALAEWLTQAHPKAPRCTAKTIRTSVVTSGLLRTAVNEAKARKERPK